MAKKSMVLVLPLKFAPSPSCGCRQDGMTFDTAAFDTGSSHLLPWLADERFGVNFELRAFSCDLLSNGNSGYSDTDGLKRSSNHTQTHEWLHSSVLDHIQSLFFTKVFYSSIISQFDLLLHSYEYFNSISQNIKDKWSSAFLSIFHQLMDSV